MKRNFYALFALLTALSGPLVMAPPAVSKAHCEIRAGGGQATDDAAEMSARFEQEHNQPSCQFPLSQQDSPEALIVLPEDFDYELFAVEEACESGLIPDSEPDRKLATESSDLPYFDGKPAFDHLCLPFVEGESEFQSWEDPPVAGVDPSFRCPAENAAVDHSAMAGGTWVVQAALQSLYTIAAGVNESVVAASERSVGAFRRVNDLEIGVRDFLLESLTQSLHTLWNDVHCEYAAYTHRFYSQELEPVERHIAERPYCFCWALEDSLIEENQETEMAPDAEGHALGFATAAATDFPVDVEGMLPEVPKFEVQLNNTPDLQNDAVEQLKSGFEIASEATPAMDLNQIGETAKQVWDVVAEKAAMLDRWSKDYDFEPFSAAGETESVKDQ